MDDDVVAHFVGITNASETVARGYLEMTDGDISQAVQLFFENPDLQTSFNAVGTAPASSAAPPARPPQAAPGQRQTGRADEHGVIHIDSDDEDITMGGSDAGFAEVDDDTGADVAATVARTAQEEEDAAMAKRLQEELYSESSTAQDGVRAPIARTTETLVAPSYGMGMADDDALETAVYEQIRRRRQPQGRPNPFSQSIWEDPGAPLRAPPVPDATGQPQTRAQRLAELFRPPYDLIAHLSWDDARTEGKEDKKWILVNLQDMTDFNCQALNRDIWKDELVRQLVQENFIFLQYSKDDPQAEQYITFYFPHAHENPDNYPHVSIIDPRTGEQVKVWSGRPFPSPQDFHSQLVEFLDRYSLDSKSKNPVPKQKRPEKTIDVDRMTEEEMLQMAMQNSLAGANGGGSGASGSGSGSGSGSSSNVHDPDALTKSVELGKAKAKAAGGDDSDDVVEVPEPEVAVAGSASAFAAIPSDRPHAEPAHDPATTTRIQFRHPDGRVIRRFHLDDTVARIYEWLKAEPLAGREGVEFELKVMPQGRDLIEELDKTIEEAGLKQGTVMVEFIQD